MNIKICGLKTPSDIDNCTKAGADFIGFVFFQKSPRHLSPANAAELSDYYACLLYTSPSPRDKRQSRMPSSA